MSDRRRVGICLCRGGLSRADSLEFKRLKWAAEAGLGPDRVFEVTQACQADGAAGIARLAKENGVESILVGACPRAGEGGPLAGELRQAGLDMDTAVVVDLFQPSEDGAKGCPVHSGAQYLLRQALAAAVLSEEPPCEEITASTGVLIVGQGLAALLAARNLAQAGYQAVVLTSTKRLAGAEPLLGVKAAALTAELAEEVKADDRITVIRQGELLELTGPAGHFTARLADREGKLSEHQVGAVIVAQGPPSAPNLGPLAIEPSERVISLSELITLANSPEHFKRHLGGEKDFKVAIAVGLGAESEPLTLRAAAETALELTGQYGAQVILLTGNAKVAAPDLESLTQKARAEGVINFKFNGPDFAARLKPDGVSLTLFDEVMSQEVVYDVDLLAFDERPVPAPGYLDLAERLGLSVGADCSLQPDQVNALPVLTTRAGVFAVGPARGGSDLDGQIDEVQEALLEIRRLLKGGQAQSQPALVTVDRLKCAVCLTCIRVCPAQAMGRIERRPVANPLVCLGCGACAAECPQNAIQLIGLSDDRYEAEIEAAVGHAESGPSGEPGNELLVFMCQNSASRAMNAARSRGQAWPDGVSVIQVPCAAKIDPSYVLEAFRAGVDGVLILSCFEDACYSFQGASWAAFRTEHIKHLLAEAGHDPNRLAQAGVAPNMSGEVMELIEGMKKQLAGLGPNPVKAGARVREILSRFTTQLDEGFVIQA